MVGTEVVEKNKAHTYVVYNVFIILPIAEIIQQMLLAWSSDSMTCLTM